MGAVAMKRMKCLTEQARRVYSNDGSVDSYIAVDKRDDSIVPHIVMVGLVGSELCLDGRGRCDSHRFFRHAPPRRGCHRGGLYGFRVSRWESYGG